MYDCMSFRLCMIVCLSVYVWLYVFPSMYNCMSFHLCMIVCLSSMYDCMSFIYVWLNVFPSMYDCMSFIYVWLYVFHLCMIECISVYVWLNVFHLCMIKVLSAYVWLKVFPSMYDCMCFRLYKIVCHSVYVWLNVYLSKFLSPLPSNSCHDNSECLTHPPPPQTHTHILPRHPSIRHFLFIPSNPLISASCSTACWLPLYPMST